MWLDQINEVISTLNVSPKHTSRNTSIRKKYRMSCRIQISKGKAGVRNLLSLGSGLAQALQRAWIRLVGSVMQAATPQLTPARNGHNKQEEAMWLRRGCHQITSIASYVQVGCGM
jgi:hypothetical protein